MDPANRIIGTDPKDLRVGKEKVQSTPDARDFQKVLEEQGSKEKEKGQGDSFSKGSDEEAPLISPFDLSRHTNQKGAKSAHEEIAFVEMGKGTLSLNSSKQNEPLFQERGVFQKQEEPLISFSQELPDLSQINPLAAEGVKPLTPIEGVAFEKTPVLPQTDIKKVIQEMVEAIKTMTTQGKTETIITLNSSPLLEGATVVITSFASAPKEFNVSFENLSLEAKKMMDLSLHQNSLKEGFETKGLVLHIVTVTTKIEHPVSTDETPQNLKKEERGQEEREDAEKRKRK